MPTTLKPEMEAQIESLAERLALTDPDSHEWVLQMALDDLDVKVPPLRRNLRPEILSSACRPWSKVCVSPFPVQTACPFG